ncbi:d34d526b-2779-4c26-b517-ea3c29081a36 [Sclerotinia trifoliorum]|uniref:D34d526b-2779-4c26-b517-ea3c29081a36 n=1 Tax=Sclerotinia trifoliorum TaxID=28548 RepID=A0A8H2VPE1_9HELO|nr:d34d526b-2779-4c26-b517-ea3c29081a36 [Sclerotinia trifoliorum]
MHIQHLFYALAAVHLSTAAPAADASEKRSDATFDYVIVGGGTAGLTIASRLSEDTETTVAVIEAGTFYQVSNLILSSTPAGHSFWIGSSPSDTNPLVDWNFVTTPQEGAAGRSIHYARGKCLGGSSARNFMIYQRGTKQSYQQWADAVGDQSYTFDSLFPYFQKSVHFTPPGPSRASNASAEYSASAFSSSGGPLEVSYANYAQPFSSYMDGAFGELGMNDIQDFNTGSIMGKQYCSSTIDPSSQSRESSQTAYYDATVQRRGNLRVYSITTAQKVLFDSNKKATGVRVQTLGIPYTINARKEVIMSAGAFQSPQLLMLSGIGPKATLEKWNIPAVSILEGVGQNMWDHIFFGPTYRVKVQTLTRLSNDFIYTTAQYLGAYLIQKMGPLTNPICDYLGWEKVPSSLRNGFSAETLNDLAQFPADWPEVEYLSGAGYVGDFSSLPTTQPKDGYQYATILSALVAPLSRGSVTLSSTSANDLPIINPSWLTSPTDQSVAIAAYKRVRAAFASKYMAPVLIGSEYFPGPDISTDAQILKTIQETLHTVWHAACTCKMGKKDDVMAVVDSKARVFGVQGLRVVDASAFAILPPGHPQSTVYALAEKIAEGIRMGD